MWADHDEISSEAEEISIMLIERYISNIDLENWSANGAVMATYTETRGYCTISINSSPLCDCDLPDEIFFSLLRLEACDMGKILSGAAFCPAISAVLWVEFKVAVCRRNQNWCSITEKTRISAKITLSRSLWQTTILSSRITRIFDKVEQLRNRGVTYWAERNRPLVIMSP